MQTVWRDLHEVPGRSQPTAREPRSLSKPPSLQTSPHPFFPCQPAAPATGVWREAGNCPAPALSPPERGLDELGAASSTHLATKSSQRTDEIPQRTSRGTHTIHEIIITVVIHLTEGRKLLIKGARKIKGTANNRGQASCVVI